jgi:hypothetical protein
VVLCATLEGATGVALIADRGFVVRVLLGAGLSEGGIAIGRLAGLALPSLGLACWRRALMTLPNGRFALYSNTIYSQPCILAISELAAVSSAICYGRRVLFRPC